MTGALDVGSHGSLSGGVLWSLTSFSLPGFSWHKCTKHPSTICPAVWHMSSMCLVNLRLLPYSHKLWNTYTLYTTCSILYEYKAKCKKGNCLFHTVLDYTCAQWCRHWFSSSLTDATNCHLHRSFFLIYMYYITVLDINTIVILTGSNLRS